jgi:hypothetical protein
MDKLLSEFENQDMSSLHHLSSDMKDLIHKIPDISNLMDTIKEGENVPSLENDKEEDVSILDNDSSKEIKGVEIIDSLQILTKSQKLKIKQNVKMNQSKDSILQQIVYDNSVEKKYNEIEYKEEKDKVICILKYDNTHLKKALQNKLKFKRDTRTQTVSPLWKMYYQILNHPTIAALPDETIKKAIPNPDEVKKQKDIYRMINGVNPNPIIKNYIMECLKDA